MATISDRPHRGDDGQGIFVVRLGDGDGARFALCQRMGTVDGSHRIPGMRQTVAELVDEQKLLAGSIADEDCGGFRTASFWSQSGKNITININ